MKKSSLLFIALGLFGVLSFLLLIIIPDASFTENFTFESMLTLEVLLYIALFIVGIYFKLQEEGFNTKELSFIAIYGTFAAVSRIPFTGLPNIQPCSYLIICAGIIFGPLIGFVIGGNVALISNIFLGQGPWTLFQIFAWGMMGASGGLFYKISERNGVNYRPKKWLLILMGFIWGLLFGWTMNLWFWLKYTTPHTLLSFMTANINSFYFDLSHAISNAIFIAIFAYPTLNILVRYRQRFEVNIIRSKPMVDSNRDIQTN